MDESENSNMETTEPIDDTPLQKLEEKARKAEEALAVEEKLRKELEGLNSKLLAEKTALLDSLAGEKGSLQEYQEKSAKLQAQKNDLDNQLRVSILHSIFKRMCLCTSCEIKFCGVAKKNRNPYLKFD